MGDGFRTFQSGEVLTSSNVQNYLMDQSVMVFAGTAARGSAIASPETGMLTYRTDGTADAKREGFEFYDGSTYVRLINPPGLELVSSTTIGSAVSSVTVSDVFSATYNNYAVVMHGGTASGSINLLLQLGATTTGYYRATVGFTYGGATNSGGAANTSSWTFCGAEADGFLISADIYTPFLTQRTGFTGANPLVVTNGSFYVPGGYQDSATSFTGFTITTSSGTITGGTIKVYGYKN